VFRCTRSGSDAARWLEIPAWMFDRVACVDEPVFAAAPHVGLSALSMLAGLLTEVLKARAASSNAPLSGASRTSPAEVQGTLTRLMVQLILEHADKSKTAAMTEADHDL